MAVLYVDQVDPQSGTTLTIGTSGDTVALGTGVVQSNMLYPAFSAVAAGSQTIADATNTILTFATEIFDTDSAYDGTNKFTVPAGEGGKYFFIANIRLDSMYDDDEIQFSFFKNGSRDATTLNYISVPKDNMSYAFGITGIIVLAATDYVQVNIYHTRGSSRTTTAASTAFSGYKIGT